jgi:F0F1-type ATP synthase membrane subunit b/b'
MFLKIDLTFLVTFFIIWILVFILSRIFFKPMAKIIQDRDAQIQGDKASSQHDMDAREQSLEKIDRTLKAARQSAEKRREEIEGEALKEKNRLIAEVSAVSKRQIEQAKAKLNEDLVRLKKELSGEAESLADSIEKRLLN